MPGFPENHSSSFLEYLARNHPDLMPVVRWPASSGTPSLEETQRSYGASVAYGTTVLGVKYAGGVVIGGDRQATEGFQVSARRIEKVFKVDSHSAIAIAGAAGPCLEMAKLFRTELEHYEKLEGTQLSCEGKANKLGQMVKANLPMVFQGLVVIPIYVGYDRRLEEGRIFKYDVTGGRYEEIEYHAVGSGGNYAKSTLKEHFHKNLAEREALQLVVRALYSAAEEDIGTGGPDLVRGIYPTAKLINVQGVVDVPDSDLADLCRELIESKREV